MKVKDKIEKTVNEIVSDVDTIKKKLKKYS